MIVLNNQDLSLQDFINVSVHGTKEEYYGSLLEDFYNNDF